MTTSSPLYPNLYIFLVGHAGIGKSRAITRAAELVRELPEIHFGATSMTMASLVDHMAEAKRTIINLPEPAIEYNSLYICADELSAFMDQFDTGLIAGLTTFFDVVPYSQGRRVKDIRIKINRPQLNILSGSTPSNLLRFTPEFAWEQGFTSRIILIYSNERPFIDVFGTSFVPPPAEMIHDLKVINSLHGEFDWTDDYRRAMNNWRELNEPPRPEHPKLEHYCARRWSHLVKLTMIAAVDAGNELVLTKDHFNTAMGWLLEAEKHMPEIFAAGTYSADSKVMDEIIHYVTKAGDKGLSEHRVVNFARERLPAYSVQPVINVLEQSGKLLVVGFNETTKQRWFVARP